MFIALSTILIYPVMVVTWLLAERSKHRFRLWFGVAAILSAAPFFLALGGFLSTFNDNICYSDVVQSVSGTSAAYAKRGDTNALAAWAKNIEALPLYGYETNCSAVQKALEAASGAVSKRP